MIIDGHCDTLSVALDKGLNFENEKLMFNVRSAKRLSQPVIQMMATFIDPKYVEEETQKSWERTNKIIDGFYERCGEVKLIKDRQDLNEVIQNNRIGAILTIENGSAICGNLNRIKLLKEKQIKVMSITWNDDNNLGCGAHTVNDTGLTELGKQYIKKLEENNIIVDISHASEKTFWDTVEVATKPIVATHSCVYNIKNHCRNLKDEQIKQIAKMGGIIGICFYSDFLTYSKQAMIEDIINNIKYIVNIVGIDYVGLGSDFDGLDSTDLPKGINKINDIFKIKSALKLHGFSNENVNKILGENWLRVLNNSFIF